MSFVSLQFAAFLPIVFFLYWLCPGEHRWKVLLGAGYVFYAFAGPQYLLLLLYVTAAAFVFGKLTVSGDKRRTVIMVLFMLLPLIYFKYSGFIAENISLLASYFDPEAEVSFEAAALPLGISFYTFSALGYVLDCRRGKITPCEDFFHLAAGISFFPCLISGPIERQHELIPQLLSERKFDYDDATLGMKIMAWGFFKKLAIADTFSTPVDMVFSNVKGYSGWPLVLAVLMFSIQIYCDFSGYTDIATGAARLFGIKLTKNFDSPYFSQSIKDFWSRWHISLSHWFRDYVYIPLGGNRRGVAKRDLNLLATFMVSGLWHGADWTYVIWGGVHGLMQIVENHLPGGGKKPSMKVSRVIKFLRSLVVYILVALAWVFFKAKDTTEALYVFSHMHLPPPPLPSGETGIMEFLRLMAIDEWLDAFKMGVSVLLLLLFDYLSLHMDVWARVKKLGTVKRWVLYIGLIILIVFFKPLDSAAQFIYFKF